MKRFVLLIAILLVACPLFAQSNTDITLAWDNADDYQNYDIESVQIFNIYDSNNPILVATVACSNDNDPVVCPTQISFSIVRGTKYVFVAAYYDGLQAGDYSNTVATPPGAKPKNLRK